MSVGHSLKARVVSLRDLVGSLEVGAAGVTADRFELGRIHGLNEALALMEGERRERSDCVETRIRAELAADRRIDVSTEVAARYFGKTAAALRHWARAGVGPIVPTVKEGVGKKRCRWRVADIRRILGVKPT